MGLFLDKQYTEMLGSRLDRFKQEKEYTYSFRCPLCGDSKKDAKKARGYIYFCPDNNTLKFKCHNCGENFGFKHFLSLVDPYLFKQYCRDLFKGEKSDSGGLTIKKEKQKPLPIYNCELFGLPNIYELDDDHHCKQYVVSRKIPKSYWKDLFYSDDFNKLSSRFLGEENEKIPNDQRLIIPFVYKNKISCIQARSLNKKSNMRYITLRHPSAKSKIYGLDRLDPEKTVYILEGPIDSMFVNNSIACADASLFKFCKDFKDVVCIYDTQPRNKDLLKIIEKTIDCKIPICLFPEGNYKDINDMILNGATISEIQDLIKRYTYKGLMAKLEFSIWKKV